MIKIIECESCMQWISMHQSIKNYLPFCHKNDKGNNKATNAHTREGNMKVKKYPYIINGPGYIRKDIKVHLY